MPLMQKWSQGDLDKMSIAVLQKQNKKPTAKEIEYTALILQRILSTTEEHDASFRQGSSRRLIRLCNGMLHILDRCLDGLEGLDETLVRDTRSAVDRLRHKLDTQKQQSEHPLDQINQMPNESAISLLLLTYVEVHGSMKIADASRMISAVSQGFQMRYNHKKYVPSMPQAIYVNIIEDGKIIIEASSESWHWIPKMHTFRAAARHRRINSYKEACSESDCHDLDMLNEHLSKQHKGLDDRKRRDFITDWIKTNGNGPRKMLKVPGIAATFKCTGENKPARFLCRARFLPEPVLEAGSIKEAENMALYGYEDCAEVSGWFALRAGKA